MNEAHCDLFHDWISESTSEMIWLNVAVHADEPGTKSSCPTTRQLLNMLNEIHFPVQMREKKYLFYHWNMIEYSEVHCYNESDELSCNIPVKVCFHPSWLFYSVVSPSVFSSVEWAELNKRFQFILYGGWETSLHGGLWDWRWSGTSSEIIKIWRKKVVI